MNRFVITPLLPVIWLVCVIVTIYSSTVVAQVGKPSVEPLLAARLQEVNRSVLSRLRDGDLAQSLKLLEAVADAATPLTLAESDELSASCAGLSRGLAQLDAEAQFELLSKWSMPAGPPPRIRVLTALVPVVSPPIEFARALGERPRSYSFAISSIGDVSGIFSSGWSLVIAARDSGRLKRLIADLGPMVDKQVPNAELLLALSHIADGRGDLSKLAEQLTARLERTKTSGAASGVIDPADVVLAVASLQQAILRSGGEEVLQNLLSLSPAGHVRSFLRQAHATAILVNPSNPNKLSVASKLAPRLKYWIPVSTNSTGSYSPIATEGIWLTHEDHILHLSGSDIDTLLFRYPIQGDFLFQCETQNGAKSEVNGGLVYKGYGFYAFADNSEFQLTDVDGVVLSKHYCGVVRQPPNASFNRLSLLSTDDTVKMTVNLHPMWTEKSSAQSGSWLGLTSAGDSRPLFRNVKLTGHAVIPRSVRLAVGNELRGWQSHVFGTQADGETFANAEWKISDDVLQAAKSGSKTASQRRDQLLSYHRPLLAGETVSYEFYYEPGVWEASPALGRVAFLLQPDGVRIHWVTDGDRDWTGLSLDHAVTEPLNRRGPRPLPFKANDWNHLTLARTESSITLTLNKAVVYQRPIDWPVDHRFGFYRHSGANAAKVRNVVMTGDWPESVPQEFLENPTIAVGDSIPIIDRHGLDQILDDRLIAENVFAVRRQALTMPVAEQFEYLSRWVLPGHDHPLFRMNGEFTPTQPAPFAIQPGASFPELGGEIMSPVFDWLDAAKELGLLAECRQRVNDASIRDDEYQQRARASLTILLSLELGDQPAALAGFEALYPLLKAQTPTGINDQWPETLVAVRGTAKFPDNSVIGELVSYLYSSRTQHSRPQKNYRWHSHIASLMGRIKEIKSTQTGGAIASAVDPVDWIPVTVSTSLSRGQGFPVAGWGRHLNSVVKRTSHDGDYLFYRLPLSGNYELECNLMDQTRFMIAGKYIGLSTDRAHIDFGAFRGSITTQPLFPPFAPSFKSTRYRAVTCNNILSIWLNGRQIRRERLTESSDPWIAVHCRGQWLGGVNDLRITGQPKVLDVVPLSNSKELTGWISYHEEAVIHEKSGWTHVDDPASTGWIIGHTNPGFAGTFTQGLLRYQRPLVEDGSIEYEFFYEPNRFETHLALDRLVFILDPTGIREHWITDGRHDQTDLAPDNVIENQNCRRGPAELPLVTGNWNRLKLTMAGINSRLELNGQLVYERTLEPTNQRTFGLFHYVGNTEVRVRNVVMRGNWPKTLPQLADQELADGVPESLESDRSRLKSIFTHDLTKEGFPRKYFITPQTSDTVSIVPDLNGVQVTQSAVGPQAELYINPRFSLSRDFDVEASFSGLRLESTEDSGIMLNVQLNDENKQDFRALRMRSKAGHHSLEASHSFLRPDGSRAYVGETKSFESTSGRIRLSRRGDQIFYLFAEEDSDQFFLFGTEPAPDADTSVNGIFLYSFCKGVGSSQVIWTKLVLRAEKMKWIPEPIANPPMVLGVMLPNGTGLRTIASPATVGLTSIGSPEWSADGRTIAMDMSNDSTTTSHIYIVNSDGSELRDLGLGCMPSFSNNGSKIVFSQPGKGIVTMNSDGTNREVIDAAGWGTQWSPDGTSIAYAKAGNITILDVKTGKSTQLLNGEVAKRYGYIYWSLSWSHDSRSIVFKGRRREIAQEELVVAHVNSTDEAEVLNSNANNISPDCTFSPDDQNIVVVMNSGNQVQRLYTISRKYPGSPQLIAEQPSTIRVSGCAYSRDGKTVVVTGHHIAQPVEWITGPIADPAN